MSTRTTLPVLAAATLLFTACGSSQKKPANQNQNPTTTETKDKKALSPKPVEVTGVSKDGEEIAFAPIYFEYDSAVIRPEFRATLQKLADMMGKRAKMTLLVEGHCDERGTEEYNIALGDRRARAIRDHLARLGIADDRISIISYGEERPAVDGDDEGAWAKNRRGELGAK